jgi:hypothetical protein
VKTGGKESGTMFEGMICLVCVFPRLSMCHIVLVCPACSIT